MILKPKSRTLGLILSAPATALVCISLFQLSWLMTAVWSISVAVVLWLAFRFIPTPDALFRAPEGEQPPPLPIRALLVLTCTGVSFFHGSNDGQKGMGLIMLILIGTVPAAYALNHAVTPHDIQDFIAASEQAVSIVDRHVDKAAILGADPREELTVYLQTKKVHPATMTALRELIRDTEGAVKAYGDYKTVPTNMQSNVRNDMYVTSETLRILAKTKQGGFTKDDTSALNNYKKHVDKATKFIPSWVKVAVALALGLGTMVGWKRIVVTVGEKIGKEHLTYAQGASAELVAMGTIWAADNFGLPVSTTHVLSSGVAGTMAANNSGLQFSTIRNIAAAWVFTLPAAALISGLLFALFRTINPN
jgi:PiT family inorganic phosphate transporter